LDAIGEPADDGVPEPLMFVTQPDDPTHAGAHRWVRLGHRRPPRR
jgi:hypothetical protein